MKRWNSAVLLQAQSHHISLILLGITALLWSTSGFLIKLIQWEAVNIAAVRSLIAAAVIFLAVRRLSLPRSLNVLGGAFAYAGTVVLFVLATKQTTAANAILLQYTAPIYVAVLSRIFVKEPISRFDFFCVSAVCGGMVLFFLDELAPGYILGNIFGVFSGVCFGLTALFLRRQKDEEPLTAVFWGNLIAVGICLPFLQWSLPDQNDVLPLFLLGVFQLGIPYILYGIAIKGVTALEAVLVPMLEPLMNPVWTFFAVGEVPGMYSMVGGGVILSILALRAWIATRRIGAVAR